MTRDEFIEFVDDTFEEYGLKIVSQTDINKSAYVPNMTQKRVFESFGIDPMDRRDNIIIKELFSDRELTISYYATLREGANRSPEPRMGLTDLITYLSVGDEILFAKDRENIYIYNLSKLYTEIAEDRIYAQIDMESLRDRASRINHNPTSVEQIIRTYPRNSVLKNYVKRRSNYSCEIPNCNYVGFLKSDGEQYIEVHHIIPLSEGGEDSIFNTVALCPNCHRAIHYSEDREAMKQILLNYLSNV
jgi:5-methylcytosine-specific restriction endonuclease McrA